jgi:hypothetical protein
MKNLLFLLLLSTTTLFGQNKEKAMHILFQNVDSTYFSEDGARWFECTLPSMRAYKVMDLFESDSTCKDCAIVKGKKEFKAYLREYYPQLRDKKMEKRVVAHFDGEVNGYLVMIWMYNEYAFAMLTTTPETE